MNLEYIELSKGKRIGSWLRRRLSDTYGLDTTLWRTVTLTMWLLTCAAVGVAALGMPTGFGTLFDVVTGVALNTIAMALSSAVLAAALAISGARIPRFTTGGFVYMGVVVYFILYFSEFGWKGAIVFSAIFALFAVGLGMLVGLLARLRGNRRKLSLLAVFAIALIVIYAAAGFPRLLPSLSGSVYDADADVSDKGEVSSLASKLADPAVPGAYGYTTFTYGSGEDKHRSEFGAQTGELSSPVDATAYLQNWSWLRERFWDFDEKRLPLNGRVWMPDGAGPFPLVLMVHGNHLMEKFSDEGYGYLGELLASRGMIAVSVDENFLNYSVWSGIPKRDMELRAWLLLKHVQQIQSFNQLPGSAFYERVDFDKVALLGHSRGGQAAAMAADRSLWFPEDSALPEASSYAIKAVIALAPTDTVVDGKSTKLRDVSYLTLQGAKDADLVNFYGDRQYGRVSFSPNSEAFKSSLYIEDANHSQFNTEWGSSDNALPTGLFIRPEHLLKPEQQRQVAKAYVSAFLETVMHDKEEYDRFFRDYRLGLGFLPATRYFNQYEGGGFRQIADFAGANRTVPTSGVTAEASEMTGWQHKDALNRQGNGKGDQGVELEWKDRGSYTINLTPEAVSDIRQDDILMFSLANMVRDMEDDEEFEEAGELEAWERMADSDMRIDVELEDRSGRTSRMPLSRFMATEPQVETRFTWLPGMESVLSKGKFEDAEEPVYQTYELPLKDFAEENPEFDPSEWSRITFHFIEGPGRVMLDDLGLMPN